MKRTILAGAATSILMVLIGSNAPAATVTVTLDVYYGDSNGDNLPDTAAAGSWQLIARSSVDDNRGISGLDTALTGVVNALGPTGAMFRAPTGLAGTTEAGFTQNFAGKSWIQDQDALSTTLDMLFGQLPVAAPGPQFLFYDVGQPKTPSIKASNDQANGQPAISGLATVVTWNFDDPLGDYLIDSDQSDNDGPFQRGVILAQGRFNAGLTPAFAASGTSANVFTALGTQTNPPAVNTIQGATTTTGVRNNLFTYAGDANLDHDVDAFQPNGRGDGQIVLANLGRNGDVLWQEGDFNGDKDCDIFQANGEGDAQILTSALGLGSTPPAQALVAPGTVAAIYNAFTGELTVDIGAGVGVLGFQTAGLFNLAANPGQNLPPLAVQFNSSVLGLFNGGNPLPTGLFSLGQVLPAGLSAGQITFGYTGIGLPSAQAAVAVVPEPAAAAVVALPGLLAARRFRKRPATR